MNCSSTVAASSAIAISTCQVQYVCLAQRRLSHNTLEAVCRQNVVPWAVNITPFGVKIRKITAREVSQVSVPAVLMISDVVLMGIVVKEQRAIAS
jgi:hypothetical protein